MLVIIVDLELCMLFSNNSSNSSKLLNLYRSVVSGNKSKWGKGNTGLGKIDSRHSKSPVVSMNNTMPHAQEESERND